MSQFRLRLLGSYPLSSPSSIFTISPSHDALTLWSRNVWISSSSLPFMCVANANSPSASTKASRSSARRSRNDFLTTDSPLRNNRSKANTHTLTLTSSILTSFFLRVMSCWNGSTFFSSRSHATVSQSKTKLCVSFLTHLSSLASTSGYFLDRSSEFRENTAARPLWPLTDDSAPGYCCSDSDDT